MHQQDKVRHIASFIKEKSHNIQAGTVAIVLGTGLGGVANAVENPLSISLSECPHSPCSTVRSHAGALVLGRLSGKPVAVFSGRTHLYEGYSAQEVTAGIRALGELGVSTIILTNAAGALNPAFVAGSPMLIDDHINLTGHNPLVGPNVDAWGERFPDMSQVWDPALRELAMATARELDIPLHRGVYAQVVGPCLETPAETRAFRRLGADAIGMSTAVEAIAAHHMGMRILGLACLTNKNLPDSMCPTTLEDVLQAADKASRTMTRLVQGVLARMD